MNNKKREQIFFVSFIILVTVLRLFISSNSPYAVTPHYGYDHGLLFKLAVTMSEGNWLGSYNCVTLAKGVGFPFFMFMSNLLNIPYSLFFGLFIALSCLLFIIALKSIIKKNNVLAIVYAFMMFCPVSYSYVFGMGVYRNAVVPWSVLGYISGIMGIFFWTVDKKSNYKSLVFWSIITAVYLSFFWMLREDSIWILPFSLASGLVVIIFAIIQRKENGKKRSAIIIFAILFQFVLCECTNLFVSYMNYKNYGIFTTNDRTGTYFAEVLSDLHHIDAGEQSDDVWISRKQLEIAFNESQTLGSARGEVLFLWNIWSGAEENELPGDIGQWALRDGISYAGHYGSATEANKFYEAVHNELSAAFKDGRIKEKKGIYLSSQARAFKIDDFTESFEISVKVWRKVRKYDFCNMQEYITTDLAVSLYDIVSWENYLGMYGVKSDEYLAQMGANDMYINFNNSERIKQKRVVDLTNGIRKIYKYMSYFLSPLMWLGYLSIIVIMIFDIRLKRKNEKTFYVWILTTGVMLCEFVHIYVSTLFSRWMDPDNKGNVYHYYNYAAASFVLIQIAEVICIAFAVSQLAALIKNKSVKEIKNG